MLAAAGVATGLTPVAEKDVPAPWGGPWPVAGLGGAYGPASGDAAGVTAPYAWLRAGEEDSSGSQ